MGIDTETRDTLDDLIAEFGLEGDAANALERLISMIQDSAREGRLRRIFEQDPLEDFSPVELAAASPLATLEEVSLRGDPLEGPTARYELLGLLGRGGMGEVWRVRDRDLNRILAMKVIRWEFASEERRVRRFIEEAQTCAQLQHPGIIPVFEIGRLRDGRLYFTMREIRGRTLNDVIKELHEVSNSSGSWGTTEDGWSFRRVMGAFARVCEAVAYAHQRGVLHRDLKPSNIMLGHNGEVLVVDWGVARVLGRVDTDLAPPDSVEEMTPVVTHRVASGEELTRPGSGPGTPNYMAPEQIEGDPSTDVSADVYALGGILYKLLTGTPPYGTGTPMSIMFRVAKGPPFALRSLARLPIPQALCDICEQAMARDLTERFSDASAMAAAINEWIEGTRRRARARAVLDESRELTRVADRLREEAGELLDQATRMLQTVPSFAPEEKKLPGWELERQADEKRQEANIAAIRAEQAMLAALNIDADLVEAHEELARHHRGAHERAERAGDADTCREAEVRLRAHLEALPTTNSLRLELERYLEGTGTLTLHTTPSGAQVKLYRYVTKNRRLVPELVRELGASPIVDLDLAPGSYLLELSHPGHHTVLYPVLIDRLGRWDGVAPGDAEPTPVVLPAEGELAADEVYVPAGWFIAGGEMRCAGGFKATPLWADAFAVQRFAVTNRDFLAFLNDLVAQGRGEEASRHAPRERGAAIGEMGSMLYDMDDEGRFALLEDASRRGRVVSLDWPVTNIEWTAALAYAEWYAEKTGQPWRLMTEWEFEKAARGVDGRDFPWGDAFDPSWACMQMSRPAQPIADVVDSFPTDVSPYDVRGVAGNVATWTLNAFSFEPPEDPRVAPPRDLDETRDDPEVSRMGCGGAWFYPQEFCQCNWRLRFVPNYRYGFLGVRLMRPM